MAYQLRDASGQFVARSSSKATAYRASRRANMAGSSVNRAGSLRGQHVVDGYVTVAVEPKWHFSHAAPRLVFEVVTYVTGRSLADARKRAERYGTVRDVGTIQLDHGYVSQAYAAREEPSIEAVERTTTDATHYLVYETPVRTTKTESRATWLKSLRRRPSKIKASDWREFLHPSMNRVGRLRNRADGDDSTHDYYPASAQFMESDHDYYPPHAPTPLSGPDDSGDDRRDLDAMVDAETQEEIDEAVEADAQAEIDAMAAASPEGPEIDDAPSAMTLYEPEVEATFEEPRRAEYHVSVTRLS